jgi:hypothetical protein
MMRAALRGLLLVLCTCACAGALAQKGEDHRAWQHGVNLVRVGDRLLVVWSSPGNPPHANPGGDWQHDVYYSWLSPPAAAGEMPAVIPQLLVSQPEAQEPASVAVDDKGTILMTCEDGNGGINQHAGLWNSDLQALRKYPFMIRRGGHSGHVAALGGRFLVTYGEDWVDGGGWRNLGTGKIVYARVVGDDGKLGREVRLTPDSLAHPRDGWPLIAASEHGGLVIWQRYPELTLQAALVDAQAGVVKRLQIIDGMPLRYAYDVEYSPELASYVVAGATGDEGFVSLINAAGEIVSTRRGLPPMQSESRVVLGRDGDGIVGVYPVRPHGVAVVHLSAAAIGPAQTVDHPYEWDYSGTTGMFVAPGRVLFATLSTGGLRLFAVDIPHRE